MRQRPRRRRRQHRRQVDPFLARAAARDPARLLAKLKIALRFIVAQADRPRQRRQGRALPLGAIASGVVPPRLEKAAQRRHVARSCRRRQMPTLGPARQPHSVGIEQRRQRVACPVARRRIARKGPHAAAAPHVSEQFVADQPDVDTPHIGLDLEGQRRDPVAERPQFEFLEDRVRQPAKRARRRDPQRRRDQRIGRLILAPVIPAKGAALAKTAARPAQQIAVGPDALDRADGARRQCDRQRYGIAIFARRRPPLAAAALGPPLDQVGRPDHAARNAHRPEQLRDLLAIGRRLDLQVGEPRSLAPLGLEYLCVDLLSDRRADRGTHRSSDNPAHHRQHQRRHCRPLMKGAIAGRRARQSRAASRPPGAAPHGHE